MKIQAKYLGRLRNEVTQCLSKVSQQEEMVLATVAKLEARLAEAEVAQEEADRMAIASIVSSLT